MRARSHDGAFARKEQAARREASIVAPWMTPAAARAGIATDSVGGIRLTDASVYDPVRATLGLAGAAAAKGARIFEQSPARRTSSRASTPTSFWRPARSGRRSSLSPAASQAPCSASCAGTSGGKRLCRRHPAADRRRCGATPASATACRPKLAAHLTAGRGFDGWRKIGCCSLARACARPPARQREKLLVPRTAQLMYELSLRYPEFSGLPARWGWEQPVVHDAGRVAVDRAAIGTSRFTSSPWHSVGTVMRWRGWRPGPPCARPGGRPGRRMPPWALRGISGNRRAWRQGLSS